MKFNFGDAWPLCKDMHCVMQYERCHFQSRSLLYYIHNYLILDIVQKTLVSIFFGTPSFTIRVLSIFFGIWHWMPDSAYSIREFTSSVLWLRGVTIVDRHTHSRLTYILRTLSFLISGRREKTMLGFELCIFDHLYLPTKNLRLRPCGWKYTFVVN